MAKETDGTVRAGRRRFLQEMVLVTGATGLGVFNAQAAPMPEASASGGGDSAKQGYRETDHIRSYYNAARL